MGATLGMLYSLITVGINDVLSYTVDVTRLRCGSNSFSTRQRSECYSRLFWKSNLFRKYKSEISIAFILHSRNLEFVMFD